MDPFEEFEFKPLTDGLGFHKKAERLKQDIQLTNLSEETVSRTVPEPPPKSMLANGDATRDLELDLTAPRPASKSISDLIAALPPSLDFLEDGEPAASKATEAEPMVSYPFLKPRKRASEPKLDQKNESTKNEAARTFASSGAGIGAGAGASESRPQIFQPLGRADYKAPSEKPASESMPAASVSIKPPTPGTPATLSGTNAASASAASISARANLPPAPTLKSPLNTPLNTPLKPGSRIDTRIDESVGRATTAVDKTQTLEKKALAAASHEMKKASASFAAATLDLMAITGIATIFLVVILMITRIDLVAMLSHAKTDLATIVHLALLFLAVMQLYMLSARCFFGATLGEWSFDLQMGTDQDQARAMYPLRVIWRMVLVLATGLITLPLLSKIFGRDLLAMLGGPQLYRRPM
ncbi:MAG: hypothetical protein NDI61_08220 [Bdellovibrionaceae bacterium]|nr:hypothetical protein [Pseudobdellovibrionaceae bacterium]